VIVKKLPFVALRNPANLDNTSTVILQHSSPVLLVEWDVGLRERGPSWLHSLTTPLSPWTRRPSRPSWRCLVHPVARREDRLHTPAKPGTLQPSCRKWNFSHCFSLLPQTALSPPSRWGSFSARAPIERHVAVVSDITHKTLPRITTPLTPRLYTTILLRVIPEKSGLFLWRSLLWSLVTNRLIHAVLYSVIIHRAYTSLKY